MKRKLTNAQMQDSLAELTDDVTELKEERQVAKAWREGAERQFDTILEVLNQAAETIRQAGINQLRYEQQANERMARADERMTRVEATVQKLSDTVDRYLSARLNGNRQN